MARSVPVRASLVRAVLLGTTAVALFSSAFIVGKAAAKVGVTSATDGDPLGKPPQEAERVLRIGIDIQANELVTTGARDRAHLVFLDGSSLTVGPDARLTIDKFVFDPTTKTGELAVSASKGVFRLVGGKISKTNPITITTPSSTIGIRGGITIFAVTQVQTTATFVFGNSMSVTASGLTQTAVRAGSQIITNAGSAPGAPVLVKQGSLNAALGQLEGTSSSGGTGGNADQTSQRSGFSSANSGQPASTVNLGANIPPNANNIPGTNAVSNATTELRPGQITPTQTTFNPTPGPNPDPNPNPNPNPGPAPGPGPSPVPQVIVSQGRFLNELPYKPNTFNPVTLRAQRNPQNNKPLAPTGTVLNQVATLTVQGGDTLQVPWLPGEIFSFSGTTPFGAANATGFVSPGGDAFAYSFVDSNNRTFVLFGGTPTAKVNFPTSGIGAHGLANLTNPGNLPFAPPSVGGDAQLKAAANESPLYTIYTPNLGRIPSGEGAPKGLQVTVAIAGTGAGQKSYMGVFIADYGTDYATDTIYGGGNYAGSYRMGGNQKIGRAESAQATADTGNGNAIYGAAGEYMAYIPDKIRTNNLSQTTTRTHQAALDRPTNGPPSSYYPVTVAAPANPADVNPNIGQTRTTQTLGGYVSGLIESTSDGYTRTRIPNLGKPTDVRISTNAATNEAMATIVLRGLNGSLHHPSNATLQLGSIGRPRDASSAFIDNQTYGMVTQTSDPSRRSKLQQGHHRYGITDHSVMASYGAAPVPLPGTPGFCTCEYLTWGWWSTSILTENGPDRGQLDRVHMGAYVAGKLASAVQMPNTGQATYTGFMAGNVRNAGNSYIASGGYNMNWSFASRHGAFHGSFDGTNYNGTASAIHGSGGVNFSGQFHGGNRTGKLNGSFFEAPGDAVKYQAGQFSIGNNNSPYKASGIFAGQR